MLNIHHVLVATDFSAHAEHATATAMALSKKLDAKVTLVHAFSLPPMAYADGVRLPIGELEREAGLALEDCGNKVKKDYPRVETLLRFGPPSDEIVAAAADRKADLIVLGTHGRQGLTHLLLGSVAERVVRLSPVPVLVVPLPG
jgi:nucleotide-binding universal stress UspA family protein